MVDGSGSIPVSACTARAMIAENSPGGVRKGSPDMIGVAVPPCRAAMACTVSDSEAPECVSLNRMDSRAFAFAGMTLCAGLIVSISVISRLLGWNHSVPVQHQCVQFRQHRNQPGDGIIGQMRIGNMALRALNL